MKKKVILSVFLIMVVLCSVSLTIAFSFRDLFTRETEPIDSNERGNTGRGNTGQEDYDVDEGEEEVEDEVEEEVEEELIVSLYSYSCNAGGKVNYAFEMNQIVNDGDDYKICVGGDCEYVCSKSSNNYKLMCMSLEPLGSLAEVELYYNNQKIFSETKQIPGCDVEVDLYTYSCNIGGKVNYAFEMDQIVSSGEGYEICIGGLCEDSCLKGSNDYKIFCTSSKLLGNSEEVKLVYNNQEIFSETKQIPECEVQMDTMASLIYLSDIENINFQLNGVNSNKRYSIRVNLDVFDEDYMSQSTPFLNGIAIGTYNVKGFVATWDNFEEVKYFYDLIRKSLIDSNNDGGLPLNSQSHLYVSGEDCAFLDGGTYCTLDLSEDSYDHIHLIEQIK